MLPAPHAVAAALWNNAGLLWRNFTADGRGGRARARAGARARLRAGGRRSTSRRSLRRAVYPLAVGSQAVPIAADRVLLVFWWGFGIFPKLVGGRADLLLPGARHDGRRPRGGRPRPAQAAAHARRLALAGVSLRRAAGGAAGGAQRRADRAGGGRDRRASSPRSPDRHHRRLRRTRTRDQRRPRRRCRPARAYAAAMVLFAFAIACFYTLALAERRLAPWAHRPRGETR